MEEKGKGIEGDETMMKSEEGHQGFAAELII